MSIKLHNRGQRVILEGDCEFKPNSVVSFPDAIAQKLLSLFEGEVYDLERTVEVFSSGEPEEEQETAEQDKPRRGRPSKASTQD